MSNFVVPDQDPMDELRRWIAEATNAGISNSAAMVLATVDRCGQPSARALMAGTREEKSITFFSHYESPKGRDLENNPKSNPRATQEQPQEQPHSGVWYGDA